MRKLVLAWALLLTASLSFGQNEQLTPSSTEEVKEQRDFSKWKAFYYEMDKAERLEFQESEYFDNDEWWSWIEQEKLEKNSGQLNKTAAVSPPCVDDSYFCEIDDTHTLIQGNEFSEGGGCLIAVDCAFGPVDLDFSFCFFDQMFTELWINANGNITFTGPNVSWVPEPFPASNSDYRIAALWADHDFTGAGRAWIKEEEDHICITWDEVGYWSSNSDLVNTYQIILTDGESDVLPDGKNFAILYKDVQWASGDFDGGANGTGGNTAYNGIDAPGNAGPGFQYGNFLELDGSYDGPAGDEDGIDWLDNKTFMASVCEQGDETLYQEPIFTNEVPNDTIRLCQGDEYDMNYTWISPASGVTLDLTAVYTPFPDFTLNAELDGSVGVFDAQIVATMANVGFHDFSFSVTDDQVEPQTDTFDIVIEVIGTTAPTMEILDENGLTEANGGDFEFCFGSSLTISASPGYDEYCWSSECTGIDCEISTAECVTVTGFVGGCTATAVLCPEVEFVTGSFSSCLHDVPFSPLCQEGDSAYISCSNPNYIDYEWNNEESLVIELQFPNPGTIFEIEGTIPGEDNGAFVGLGQYGVSAFNQITGCREFAHPIVKLPDNVLPEIPATQLFCGDLEAVEFEEGYNIGPESNIPAEFSIATFDQLDGTWDGATINVTINGVLVEFVNFVTNTPIFDANITFFESNETAENHTWSYPPGIIPGDEVVITLTNGFGDQEGEFFTINLNASCGGNIGGFTMADLADGVIVDFFADCPSSANGVWSVNDDDNSGLFSDNNSFNSTFTPDTYGVYELCFSDQQCENHRCTEVTYDAPIDADIISNNDPLILCDGETFIVDVDFDNPEGLALEEQTWTNPVGSSVDVGYIYATISNTCYSVTDSLFVAAQDDNVDLVANMNDFVCDGGILTLNPVENTNGNILEFDWLGSGINSQVGPTVDVDQTGVYSVEISGFCFDPVTVEGIVDIQGAIQPEMQDFFSCDETTTQLFMDPEALTYTWTIGDETFSSPLVDVDLSDNGQLVTVVAEYLCETVEITEEVQFAESISVIGSDTPTVACPDTPVELCVEFTGTASNFSWNAPWGTIGSTSTSCIDLFSDQIPNEFLNQIIEITVNASGPCLGDVTSVYVVPDLCELNFYNVITPDEDEDELNEGWFIEGLDSFIGSDINVKIFDRWGRIVFETSNYNNEKPWKAEDQSEGTYYYTVDVPDFDRAYSGVVTVLRK